MKDSPITQILTRADVLESPGGGEGPKHPALGHYAIRRCRIASNSRSRTASRSVSRTASSLTRHVKKSDEAWNTKDATALAALYTLKIVIDGSAWQPSAGSEPCRFSLSTLMRPPWASAGIVQKIRLADIPPSAMFMDVVRVYSSSLHDPHKRPIFLAVNEGRRLHSE